MPRPSATAPPKVDPDRKAGKAATAKLTELQPKLDLWKKHEADRQAADALAEAEAQAAQAEADAKCPERMTIRPNGAGINTFPSKATCQGLVDSMKEMGVRCDPCHCWK